MDKRSYFIAPTFSQRSPPLPQRYSSEAPLQNHNTNIFVVEGESASFRIGEQGGSAQIRGQNDGMHASLGGESAGEQVTQKKRGSNSEKASKPTKKRNVAGKGKKKTSVTDAIDGSSDEENSKRGPNWKDHWVVNLIHLRGTMHDKFSGMKKQGVDNWAVLHTELVAACPDFNRSSDACRKKWKKIYDDYKSDYDVNGVSGNERASKCKWYALIDSYMHERANVMKHVHGSATDTDADASHLDGVNGGGIDGEQMQANETQKRTQGTSKLVGKRGEKLATQEAIQELSQQSKLH